MQLFLFNNQQNQGAGNLATAASFQSANLPASDFLDALVNDNLTFTYNNTNRASLAETFTYYCCNANFNDDYIPNGWQRSICPGVRVILSSSDLSFYNSDIVGRHFKIYIGSLVCSSNLDVSVPANIHLCEWDFVFPVYNSFLNMDIPNSGSHDWSVGQQFNCSAGTFSISNIGFRSYELSPVPSCDDSRSSGANQMIDISITGSFEGDPTTFNYSLGFPTPSSDVVNVSVSVPSSMRMRFDEFVGCDASFSGGVIRNDGILKIYGRFTGYGVGDVVESGIVDEEVLICQLSFIACCDDAVSFTDTISDYLTSFMIDYVEFIGDVEVTKFVYSGFGSLNNYCCDDVSCSDDEPFDFDDNSTILGGGGSGGGGDDGGDDSGTDVTCICDNLESLIDLLSNKLTLLTASVTALSNGLTSIVSAVSGLDVDNTSIASAINNKVIPTVDTASIASAINNKVIPTVDTSSIASAINNKVIPTVDTASITSAINNKVIPVTDVSGVVTGLGNVDSTLGSIDSALGQIDSSIAGGTADITTAISDVDTSLGLINTSVGDVSDAVSNVSLDSSALSCVDDEGNEESIACILKNALNNRDLKGLADVIEDKDVGGFTDVTIEPYDLVNIRRAFRDDNNNE